MITPLPIETAPKDGTKIFAYDGVWWRDRVCWQVPYISKDGTPCWTFQGFLPIQPTHWYPINGDYDDLLKEVAKGYAHVAHRERTRGGRLADPDDHNGAS